MIELLEAEAGAGTRRTKAITLACRQGLRALRTGFAKDDWIVSI